MAEQELILRFKSEVLDSGPESALPERLSDFWLEELSNQADEMIKGNEDARATEVFAAVLHLLLGKTEGEELQISDDQLMDYLQRYRIELAIETVRRRTELEIDPASLESIFTDRNVKFGLA